MEWDMPPVKGPWASQWRSWAASRIDVPRMTGPTAAREVNGGATATSRLYTPSSAETISRASPAASVGVVFIFQFPAMKGVRTFSTPVGEGCDTRQDESREEFQGRPASGGDMTEPFRKAETAQSGRGVSASGHAQRATGHDGFGDGPGTRIKGRSFEDSHGTVPKNGPCGSDLSGKSRGRFRPDVQSHESFRNRPAGNQLSLARFFHRRSDTMIHRKEDFHPGPGSGFQDFRRHRDIRLLHLGRSHRYLPGCQEGVRHGASDEEG